MKVNNYLKKVLTKPQTYGIVRMFTDEKIGDGGNGRRKENKNP